MSAKGPRKIVGLDAVLGSDDGYAHTINVPDDPSEPLPLPYCTFQRRVVGEGTIEIDADPAVLGRLLTAMLPPWPPIRVESPSAAVRAAADRAVADVLGESSATAALLRRQAQS